MQPAQDVDHLNKLKKPIYCFIRRWIKLKDFSGCLQKKTSYRNKSLMKVWATQACICIMKYYTIKTHQFRFRKVKPALLRKTTLQQSKQVVQTLLHIPSAHVKLHDKQQHHWCPATDVSPASLQNKMNRIFWQSREEPSQRRKQKRPFT